MASTLEHFVRELPKAELHVHLEGTLEPELALELARRNGESLPFASVEEARDSYRFRDLSSFLDLYYRALAGLRTERDFRELTLAYLRRARRDGVRHVELFFDPQAHTGRGVALESVIAGISAGLERGGRELGVSSHLILCFLRDRSEAEALEILERALPLRERIVAVGLDSAERGNPPSKFVRVFRRAREAGFRVVAHAGEEGPPAYVREALDLLGAERIDHGVRALEDPALVERLAAEQIPLTVCPLSNVTLGIFPSLEAHCLPQLLEAGLLVTLNSDDPAYFGGYVADNYLAVARALRLDRAQLAALAANGFHAAFLDEPIRAAYLEELRGFAAAD